jgi:hypothetical protein
MYPILKFGIRAEENRHKNELEFWAIELRVEHPSPLTQPLRRRICPFASEQGWLCSLIAGSAKSRIWFAGKMYIWLNFSLPLEFLPFADPKSPPDPKSHRNTDDTDLRYSLSQTYHSFSEKESSSTQRRLLRSVGSGQGHRLTSPAFDKKAIHHPMEMLHDRIRGHFEKPFGNVNEYCASGMS